MKRFFLTSDAVGHRWLHDASHANNRNPLISSFPAVVLPPSAPLVHKYKTVPPLHTKYQALWMKKMGSSSNPLSSQNITPRS